MDPALTALFTFLLVAGVLSAVYVPLYGSRRALQRRYEEMALRLRLGAKSAEEAVIDERPARTHTALQWAAARLPAPMNPAGIARLSRNLVRAGFNRSSAVHIFRVIRLTAAVGGAVLGLVIGFILVESSFRTVLVTLIGGVVGGYAPVFYLARRANARQRAISLQLSDVLDLLVVCMEAGLGLFEAIRVVGEETERQGQVIGSELMQVAGEVAAGASLGQALRALSERTAVEDIRPLAATLIQSEQLGAQMAPALKASSDALRTRRRLRAEEAAQKSTIKILFPLVLFVLPAMLIAILAPAVIQALHTLSQ